LALTIKVEKWFAERAEFLAPKTELPERA